MATRQSPSGPIVTPNEASQGPQERLDCFVARAPRNNRGGDADLTSNHRAPEIYYPAFTSFDGSAPTRASPAAAARARPNS
jgi:hypothetical protein